MDSRQILQTLYREPPASWPVRLVRRILPAWAGGQRKLRPFYVSGESRTGYKVLGALVLSAWLVAYLYYYNELIEMQSACDGTWAQVEALQQRRAHIGRNLTLLTNRYARYEEAVLMRVTQLRTGAPDGALAAATAEAAPATSGALVCTDAAPAVPPGAADLEDLLGRLHIIAEEYPELHLTENLQQFGASVIESERDIAAAVMKYNDAVNTYRTELDQFPVNIFGWFGGFEHREFHRPGSDDLRFQPVSM